jgi:hypothetical protein
MSANYYEREIWSISPARNSGRCRVVALVLSGSALGKVA